MLDPFSPDGRDPLAPEFDPNEDGAGAVLLDDVQAFIERFCVFPDEHCAPIVALWAAHAHMTQHFHTTPRLALLSAEWGSGKTRVLEVLHTLTPDSEFALSASAAVIFRMLGEGNVTLLFDEVDTVFRQRSKDDPNEDLRAVLNSGYRRGATVPRCVGPKHEVARFPVFCATALAGIGDLPETVQSRSIIIQMRRRKAGETVEPFRSRVHECEGHMLRDMLAEWAEVVGLNAGKAWPELPHGIVDRPAEVWEPILAVADQAGGHWPQTARVACLAFYNGAQTSHVSLGVRLLADMRTLFGDADAMATADLIERLCVPEDSGLEVDAPWAEIYGKPVTPRLLASLLKKYNIKSTKVKIDGRPLQGYRRQDLWDAWARYLPPTPGIAEPMEPAEPSEPVPFVPSVPRVPADTGSERAPCPNCGGEGCQWCRNGART